VADPRVPHQLPSMKRQPHADTPGQIPSTRHILSLIFSSSPTHTRHTDLEGARNSEMIHEFTMAWRTRDDSPQRRVELAALTEARTLI
jgi:hypothetical protein